MAVLFLAYRIHHICSSILCNATVNSRWLPRDQIRPIIVTLKADSAHMRKFTSVTRPLSQFSGGAWEWGYNKCDIGICASKFHHFCTITFYFIWPNFSSIGIPFQSTGTGNMQHPTGVEIPLCTFRGKLQTFPMVKSRMIESDRTLQLSSAAKLLSVHYTAYSKVAGHVLPYMVHMTLIMWTLKIGRSAWQNNFHCYRHAYRSNEVRTTVSIAVNPKNLLPVYSMIKPAPRVFQSAHLKQLDPILNMPEYACTGSIGAYSSMHNAVLLANIIVNVVPRRLSNMEKRVW